MTTDDYEITITVDTNDADYNSRVTRITAAELEQIKPLIEAIKNFQPYTTTSKDGMGLFEWTHRNNYPSGENGPREDLGEKFPRDIYPQFDEGLHELFWEHCPSGDFHTYR